MADKNKSKILIIEDSQDFLEILSTKLKKEGFNIVTAENGELGVKAAKVENPSLILMDVQMPVMNGIDAFYKLKEDPATKDIKVVFLTNYGEPSKDATWLDDKFAREIGAQDYIKKTDDLDSIVKSIEKALGD